MLKKFKFQITTVIFLMPLFATDCHGSMIREITEGVNLVTTVINAGTGVFEWMTERVAEEKTVFPHDGVQENRYFHEKWPRFHKFCVINRNLWNSWKNAVDEFIDTKEWYFKYPMKMAVGALDALPTVVGAFPTGIEFSYLWRSESDTLSGVEIGCAIAGTSIGICVGVKSVARIASYVKSFRKRNDQQWTRELHNAEHTRGQQRREIEERLEEDDVDLFR